jgi:hypothetical protein
VTVVSSGVLPNDSCQLQYANSLIPPVTWANVGGAVVASGTTVTNTDTTATGAERYYRLQLQTQ